MIGQYLKIWNLRAQKNLNTEKIIFKVVQMKFSAMHITNQTNSVCIFTVGNVQNIFGIQEKSIILTHTFIFVIIFQFFDPGFIKKHFF